MSSEIRARILSVIQEIAAQQNISLPEVKNEHAIVDDLGFTSLSVATLIANLEEVFGCDPFTDEDVMITDIRTVEDLCRVYIRYLEQTCA